MAGPEENGFVPWVVAAILASAGVLTSAIAYLFKGTEFQNAQAIQRLEKAKAEEKEIFKAFQEAQAAEIRELKKLNEEDRERSRKCDEDRLELHKQLSALLERVKEIDSLGTKYARGHE
jgi:biopolymer transport protein ExbB/TolQ